MEVRKRVKEIRRESDPSTKGKRLEAHHIDSVHEGGRTTLENLYGLTLAEHASVHRLLAQMGKDERANWWATSKIVQRMTPDELAEFNDMLRKKKR